MGGIRHERTNIPRGLVSTKTLKSQVLALGVALGVDLIQRIVALAELDGVPALRLGSSRCQIGVRCSRARIGDVRRRLVCKRRRREGADKCCNRSSECGKSAQAQLRYSHRSPSDVMQRAAARRMLFLQLDNNMLD